LILTFTLKRLQVNQEITLKLQIWIELDSFKPPTLTGSKTVLYDEFHVSTTNDGLQNVSRIQHRDIYAFKSTQTIYCTS
jgi:hypothetical protein